MSISKYFTPFIKQDLLKKVTLREGENKIIQSIAVGEFTSTTRYAIIGVPEHIGVLANIGRSRSNGTKRAFEAFANHFIKLACNKSLEWNKVSLLGSVNTEDLYGHHLYKDNKREVVSMLDIRVEECIKSIIDRNVIPIVVGGGHNNAYPIIKAISEKAKKKLSVLNFDAHGDVRKLEGRHSGNPFSYAFHNKFLNNYSVLAFDKIVAHDHIIEELARMNAQVVTHESIICQEPGKTNKKLKDIVSKLGSYGLEIDTDVMKDFPTNADTVTGLTVEQVRNYLITAVDQRKPEYLHISEAAPLNDMEDNIVGSAISHIISDFVKHCSKGD